MADEARPLEVLILLIKEDLRRGDEVISHRRAMGELLREAMPQFARSSDWERWLEKDRDLSPAEAWHLIHLSAQPVGGRVTRATLNILRELWWREHEAAQNKKTGDRE